MRARGGFSGRAAPNVGVVKVPDERLDKLTELFHPRNRRDRASPQAR